MSTIVTRSVKGSALSFTEMDSNFGNLNTDKLENITAENIGDLSDVVQTGTPADNELLAYDTGTSKWINQTAAEAGLSGLTSFSVGAEAAASGDGAIAYNNGTGVFTYTPPTAAGISAATSAQGALADSAMQDLIDDATPQLGSNLDVLTNEITTSTTNGNIDLSANGTGKIRIGQGITHKTTDADFNIDANGTGDINLNGPVNIDDLLSFAETIQVLGGVSGTLSINAADGPIKYVVPAGPITINGLASPVSGQTVTLLIDQATYSSNLGSITLGAGLLTPAGGGVTLTDSGYDLVTITCVDSSGGVYIVTAINNFQ